MTIFSDLFTSIHVSFSCVVEVSDDDSSEEVTDESSDESSGDTDEEVSRKRSRGIPISRSNFASVSCYSISCFRCTKFDMMYKKRHDVFCLLGEF